MKWNLILLPQAIILSERKSNILFRCYFLLDILKYMLVLNIYFIQIQKIIFHLQQPPKALFEYIFEILYAFIKKIDIHCALYNSKIFPVWYVCE